MARALDGGVNLVQIREKDLPGALLLALARRLRELTRERALLFVNERVDVALACAADGVQLGEEGVPVEAARRVAPGLLVGRSVHSVEGALEAQEQGADLLIVGPIFPTGSHPVASAAGIRLLAAVAERVRTPCLAIGGVIPENVASVMAAGAWGAAVISAILGAPDPHRAAGALREAMDRFRAQRPAAQRRPAAGATQRTTAR